MRIRVVLAAALLVLLPATSRADCNSLSQVVHSYLADHHPTPHPPMRIAVYDTADRSWYAFRWDGTSFEDTTKSSLDVSFSNDPTLFVRRGEDPAVLIAHANPLLYETEVTSISRADIKGLAELQALTALFGGSIQSIAVHAATAKTQPKVTTSAVNGFQLRTRAEGEVWSFDDTKAAKEELEESRVELEKLVIEFQNALKQHHDPLAKSIETNAPKINETKEAVVALDNIRAEIVEKLQEAENGTHSPLNATLANNLTTLRSAVLAVLDKAGHAAMEIRNAGTVCTGSLEALNAVLQLTMNGIPVDPDKSLDAQNALRAALRNLRPNIVENHCPSQKKEDAHTKRLHDAILALADWLRDPLHRAAVADEYIYELLADARETGTIYLETAAQRTEVLAAAKKVNEARPGALKLAMQLQQFGKLYESQTIDSKCWLTAGIVEVDRIRRSGFDLPWFQVQTEEYAMTVRPMFKDDIVRNLPDTVKGKYSFSRGNFGFGVDTALIYSPANDREYKTATRPSDANHDGSVAPGETEIFPAETSRTDRTGKLALMLTVSPKWTHGFGAQLGFGVDTDNPAGFIGLTRNLGRFARLSVGHTQQRVTRLGSGLTLDTPLKSADDLRTRERFDGSWYAAVAFTISELPIFKTK